MPTMSEDQSNQPKSRFWKRLNWWKIGFFVMLAAFEFTRELLVLKSGGAPAPNARAVLMQLTNYTTVSGVWKRTDNGEELAPTLVTIECYEADGFCMEATNHWDKDYVFAPKLTRLNAEFRPDMITYVNDAPLCIQYVVRLDLNLKKVSMVREQKAQHGTCDENFERIEATLVDGIESSIERKQEYYKDQFLPILSGLKALLG